METISIGEWKILTGTGTLRTCGLGSCISVVLYDRAHGIAGMVHIMLPDASQARKGPFNPWRYADTALNLLQEKLLKVGATNLQAKMVGGAQMFRYAMREEFMQIGKRNIEATTTWLEQAHIPILAREVGGTVGRTVEFDLSSCTMRVRTANKPIKLL